MIAALVLALCIDDRPNLPYLHRLEQASVIYIREKDPSGDVTENWFAKGGGRVARWRGVEYDLRGREGRKRPVGSKKWRASLEVEPRPLALDALQWIWPPKD